MDKRVMLILLFLITYFALTPICSMTVVAGSVSTQDSEPPVWPYGNVVSLSDETETAVTLHWGEATDNIAVTGYEILRIDNQTGTVVSNVYTATGNVYSCRIENLDSQITYKFKLVALDAEGNRSTNGPEITLSPYTVLTSFRIDGQNAARLVGGKELTIEADIWRNRGIASKSLLVAALYNADGTMVNIVSEASGMELSGRSSIDLKLQLPTYVTGYSVKAFVLDGTDIASSNLQCRSSIAEISSMDNSSNRREIRSYHLNTAGFPANQKTELDFSFSTINGTMPVVYSLRNYKYDYMKGKIVYKSSSPAIFFEEQDVNGQYKVSVLFSTPGRHTITLESSELGLAGEGAVNITVPDQSPSTITNINIPSKLVTNATIQVDASKIRVENGAGSTINLENQNKLGLYHYYIKVSSKDTNIISLLQGSTDAYKDQKVNLIGGPTIGSTDVVFDLCQDNDDDSQNGGFTIIDSKVMTFTNVDEKDLVGYKFVPISILYSGTGINVGSNFSSLTKYQQAYAKTYSIRGVYPNGTEVVLRDSNILNVSINDQNKFGIDLLTGYVFARNSNNLSDNNLVTGMVEGYNNVIYSISAEIMSSREVPVAQSITVKSKGDAEYITNNASTFTIRAMDFKSKLIGKQLCKFNATGSDSSRADIYFEIKDQYNTSNPAMSPSSYELKRTDSKDAATLTIGNNGTLGGYVENGQQYILTAQTSNGLKYSITLDIR